MAKLRYFANVTYPLYHALVLQRVQVAEVSTLEIQGKKHWINSAINYKTKSQPVGTSADLHTKPTDYRHLTYTDCDVNCMC